jgi:DNA-binding NtrC family response regulator
LGARYAERLIEQDCAALLVGVYHAQVGQAVKAVSIRLGIPVIFSGIYAVDEVGELDLNVQAKLLRVLETREVLALGESKPRRVDIRICSATHRDLRMQAAEKRFREDLYFRIGRPHVAVPPLRDRPEEIPFFIEREVRAVDPRLTADASFVEACLLRHWPGNVRELAAEVREAARATAADDQTMIDASRLASAAGASFEGTRDLGAPAPSGVAAAGGLPSREVIEDALRREEGRIATTARVLGLHRNQLRRWLAKNNVDPKQFAPADPIGED